jgi:hypothetical protein
MQCMRAARFDHADAALQRRSLYNSVNYGRRGRRRARCLPATMIRSIPASLAALFQVAAHQAQRTGDRGVHRLGDHEEEDVLKLGRAVGAMDRRDAPRAGVAHDMPAADGTTENPPPGRVDHDEAEARCR